MNTDKENSSVFIRFYLRSSVISERHRRAFAHCEIKPDSRASNPAMTEKFFGN
jgi:hypothetical protein